MFGKKDKFLIKIGQLEAENTSLKNHVRNLETTNEQLQSEVYRFKSWSKYGEDDLNTAEGLMKFKEKLKKREKELDIHIASTKVPALEKATFEQKTENKYLTEYNKKLEKLLGDLK